MVVVVFRKKNMGNKILSDLLLHVERVGVVDPSNKACQACHRLLEHVLSELGDVGRHSTLPSKNKLGKEKRSRKRERERERG